MSEIFQKEEGWMDLPSRSKMSVILRFPNIFRTRSVRTIISKKTTTSQTSCPLHVSAKSMWSDVVNLFVPGEMVITYTRPCEISILHHSRNGDAPHCSYVI